MDRDGEGTKGWVIADNVEARFYVKEVKSGV
jgi:hypothetical protein